MDDEQRKELRCFRNIKNAGLLDLCGRLVCEGREDDQREQRFAVFRFDKSTPRANSRRSLEMDAARRHENIFCAPEIQWNNEARGKAGCMRDYRLLPT